jgi:hypothetical protein
VRLFFLFSLLSITDICNHQLSLISSVLPTNCCLGTLVGGFAELYVCGAAKTAVRDSLSFLATLHIPGQSSLEIIARASLFGNLAG